MLRLSCDVVFEYEIVAQFRCVWRKVGYARPRLLNRETLCSLLRMAKVGLVDRPEHRKTELFHYIPLQNQQSQARKKLCVGSLLRPGDRINRPTQGRTGLVRRGLELCRVPRAPQLRRQIPAASASLDRLHHRRGGRAHRSYGLPQCHFAWLANQKKKKQPPPPTTTSIASAASPTSSSAASEHRPASGSAHPGLPAQLQITSRPADPASAEIALIGAV